MLGFAAGSSWLAMLQDDEEGVPDPSPEQVGLSPRGFITSHGQP